MPYNVPSGSAVVQVQRDAQTSNSVSVTIAPHAPRLLTPAFNQDNTPNSPANPANRGDTIVIYGFGLGGTTPAVTAGSSAPGAPGLATVSGNITVSFGGIFGATAAPAFAGLTPPFAGVYQVNVQIPAEGPTGLVLVTVNFPETRSNSLSVAIQ
jgi:uncharacterized protein (TIGR03437 family)